MGRLNRRDEYALQRRGSKWPKYVRNKASGSQGSGKEEGRSAEDPPRKPPSDPKKTRRSGEHSEKPTDD